MAPQGNANIGTAYDFIASDYDALMRPDMRMRRGLWRHYKKIFRAGDRVLDFGCGTGIDAMYLARLGIRVTGIDASPEMICQFLRKANGEPFMAEAQVGTLTNLKVLPASSFSGVVSAFAALNTVPDLSAFAAEAHRLLEPGGRLVAHFLARPGFWEVLEYISRWRLSEARKRRACLQETILVCGEPVTHTLLPARETYNRFFRERFQLCRSHSLGFLWPQGWDGSVPERLADAGNRLEAIAGRFQPFLDWGRFFVLDLKRRA